MTASALSSSTALHAAVRAVMVEAATRAILPRFGQLARDEVHEKAADELVTVADQESEAILAEGLARITPEAAIVGEEAADADPNVTRLLADDLCWIIDPLDGTANFAAGEGPFGILVALSERGLAIGGWILDPRSGRFCGALRGEGTRMDGELVRSRASGASVPSAAISSLLEKSARGVEVVSRISEGFETLPIPRCAAEQYPRIILGVNDITLYERTLAWDHAAGALCLSEAGGVVTRFDGSPYRVDDDRTGLIAAATPALWQLAIDRLGGV
jgi:fructose-1,6-bisphosphatase/inositol monophosphatase family enzyme